MNDSPKTSQAASGKTATLISMLAAGVAVAALAVALTGPNASEKMTDVAIHEGSTAPKQMTVDVTAAIRGNTAEVLDILAADPAFKSKLDSYLMDNPESMLDALDAYREAQQAEANKPVSADLRAAIEDPEQGRLVSLYGDASNPVTIVKFHDDNCGYCRRVIETVERIAAERDDVHLAVRPFPVLGQGSRAAAEVSIGLAEQGLYKGWYKTLPSDDVAQLDRDNALALAEELGADIQKLEDAMNAGETNAELSENLELGREAGVRGTPTFFVNGKRVRGAVPYEAMVQEIEDALARAEAENAG